MLFTLCLLSLAQGSSTPHAISGELIAIDHVNRTGTLRPDRDDTQLRGNWDIAKPFVMMPQGTFRYHGAPASLKDIPLGTHLHGQFIADAVVEEKKPAKKGVVKPPTYTRVLAMEDDFSFDSRQNRIWRVEAIDPATETLTLMLLVDGKAAPKPTVFKTALTTRVWKGRGLGTHADIAAGQTVLVNLTVCTLKGPGRVTDIWLDAEARAAAIAHQLEVHRLYQKEHGLAGSVTAVDNKAGIVEVTLFDGFDRKLLDSFVVQESLAAAVAEESLRTWDQINDVKRAAFSDIKVGDKLLTKTHGTGSGKHRVCWEVFLDDASRDAFQAEQKAIHAKRLEADGLPGYVDAVDGPSLTLTLFSEGMDVAKGLKAGAMVQVSPAGVDRVATGTPATGKIASIKAGKTNTHQVTITFNAAATGFTPAGLARLRPEPKK